MRDWLKEKRQAKNLTMAEMAEKMDITESYYCLIENGERQKKMDIAIATKLATILDMPVGSIVELEGR